MHALILAQFSNSLASSIIFVQYNKTVAPKEVEQGMDDDDNYCHVLL